MTKRSILPNFTKYSIYHSVIKHEKFSLACIKIRDINLQCGSLLNQLVSRIFLLFPHYVAFKNFREINLQYNSLVKKLLWRNLCEKIAGARENFQITTLCAKCTFLFFHNSVRSVVKNWLIWFHEIFQKWLDYKMKWNPEDYGGVEMLYVPSQHIWLPDIVLFNK